MPSNRSDLVLCIGYTVFCIGVQANMGAINCSRFRGVGYGTLFHSRRSVERQEPKVGHEIKKHSFIFVHVACDDFHCSASLI